MFFCVLIISYWFNDRDAVGWFELSRYIDDDVLDEIRSSCFEEELSLQERDIIDFTGFGGIKSKDYVHIKDEIKEEIFEDVGGIRQKEWRISAASKLDAENIVQKEMFYNESEGGQVAQLRQLLGEDRFNHVRTKIKEKGLRAGFTCLFYGGPGTGKTETAYQLARECGRDLFIVDVSQIKSCWVGESEKNIKNIFDNYRERVKKSEVTPILLFNEADAIINTRLEGAQTAVNKMENSIQNIILQEMENLDGILIATTNLAGNMDKAFERRFLYKIKFEKPTLEARMSIWHTMIPALDESITRTLATKYDFSGGQIENIARHYAINNILHGQTDNTIATLTSYCDNERLETKENRKIGF